VNITDTDHVENDLWSINGSDYNMRSDACDYMIVLM